MILGGLVWVVLATALAGADEVRPHGARRHRKLLSSRSVGWRGHVDSSPETVSLLQTMDSALLRKNELDKSGQRDSQQEQMIWKADINLKAIDEWSGDIMADLATTHGVADQLRTDLKKNVDFEKNAHEQMKERYRILKLNIKDKIGASQDVVLEKNKPVKEKLGDNFGAIVNIFMEQRKAAIELNRKIGSVSKIMMRAIKKKGDLVKNKVREVQNILKLDKTDSLKDTKQLKYDANAVVVKLKKDTQATVRTLDRKIKSHLKRAKNDVNTQTKRTKDVEDAAKNIEQDIKKLMTQSLADYDKISKSARGTNDDQKKAREKRTDVFKKSVEEELSSLMGELRSRMDGVVSKLTSLVGQNNVDLMALKARLTNNIGVTRRDMELSSAELHAFMNDSSGEVDAALKALRDFLDRSSTKIEEVGSTLDVESASMRAITESSKQSWTQDKKTLESGLKETFDAVGIDITKKMSVEEAQNDVLNAKMISNLQAVSDKADMGLEGLKTQLDALSNVRIEEFNVEEEMMQKLGDLLVDFSGGISEYDKEAGAMLLGVEMDISKALSSNKESLSQTTADLLSSLTVMDQVVSGEIRTEEGKFESEAKASALKLSTDTENAEHELEADMDGQKASLNGIDDARKKSIANLKEGYSKNNAGSRDLSGEMTQLEAAEVRNGNSFRNAKNTIDGSVSKMAGQYADTTRGAVNSVEGGAQAALDKSASQVQGEIDGELRSTSGSVDGELGSLKAVENVLRKGMGDLAANGESLNSRFHKLRGTMTKINADISKQFNDVKATLSAEKLSQYETVEELQDAAKQQREQMEKLFKDRISKMSAEDREAYEDKTKQRMADVEEMLKDGSKSFEEKKALLQEYGSEMSDLLGELETESQMSESELEAIQAEMKLVDSDVRNVVDDVHSEISVDEMLSHKTEEETKAALEARSAAILKGIERTGLDLSGELGGRISTLMSDANSLIHQIAHDKSLSEEEKKLAIAKIDATAKENIARLATVQVSSEHELESFEESAGEFDTEAEGQMAELEHVLKDVQLAYVRQTLAVQQTLKDQSTQTHAIMATLLATTNREREAAGRELTAEEKAQQIQMEKLLMYVKGTGQELSSYAQEALQLAVDAQERAQSTESLTESELEALKQKVGALSEGVHSTGINLKKRLEDERLARKKAEDGQKGYVMRSASSVVEQLEYIANVLVHVADGMRIKQRTLSNRVQSLKSMMERHVKDGEDSAEAVTNKIVVREKLIEDQTKDAEHWDYLDDLKKETVSMMDHARITASDLDAGDAAAQARILETKTKVLSDVGSETAHMETDAAGRAKKYSITGNDLISKTNEFIESQKAQIEKSLAQDKEQEDDFVAKEGSWQASEEAVSNATLNTVSEYLSEATKEDHAMDRMKAMAERGVQKHAHAQLQTLEQQTLTIDGLESQLQSRSSMMQASDATSDEVRIGQLSKRVTDEEDHVAKVEQQNEELRSALQKLHTARHA